MYSLAGVALLGVAGIFIYQALANSLVYFIVPSEYAAAPAKYEGRIRLGGLVEAKSIKYDDKALDLAFNVTDGVQTTRFVTAARRPNFSRPILAW